MKHLNFSKRGFFKIISVIVVLVAFQNCNKFATSDMGSDQSVDLASNTPPPPSMPGQLIVKLKGSTNAVNFQSTSNSSTDKKVFIADLKSKYQAKKIATLSVGSLVWLPREMTIVRS